MIQWALTLYISLNAIPKNTINPTATANMNTIMTGCRQKIPFISSSSLLVFRCFAREKKRKKEWFSVDACGTIKIIIQIPPTLMRMCQRLLKNEIQCRKHELPLLGSSLLAPAGTLAKLMSPQKGPPLSTWPEVNGLHLRGNFKKSYLQSTTFTKTALSSFLPKSQT